MPTRGDKLALIKVRLWRDVIFGSSPLDLRLAGVCLCFRVFGGQRGLRRLSHLRKGSLVDRLARRFKDLDLGLTGHQDDLTATTKGFE